MPTWPYDNRLMQSPQPEDDAMFGRRWLDDPSKQIVRPNAGPPVSNIAQTLNDIVGIQPASVPATTAAQTEPDFQTQFAQSLNKLGVPSAGVGYTPGPGQSVIPPDAAAANQQSNQPSNGLVAPWDQTAALQEMAKPFVTPTAPKNVTNFMSDAGARELNPQLGDQIAGFGSFTPQQISDLQSKFQAADQSALEQSYASGRAKTGQNVPGLDSYLRDIAGPNMLESQYTPEMRILASQMQRNAAGELMRSGQQQKALDAAQLLEQMKITSNEKIADKHFNPDNLARKEFDNTVSQLTKANVPTKIATRKAQVIEEQRQIAAGKKIDTPATDLDNAQSLLDKSFRPGEKATDPKKFDVHLLAANLMDPNLQPKDMDALVKIIQEQPGGVDEIMKQIAGLTGKHMIIGTSSDFPNEKGDFGKGHPRITSTGVLGDRQMELPGGTKLNIEKYLPSRGTYQPFGVGNASMQARKDLAAQQYDKIADLLVRMEQSMQKK